MLALTCLISLLLTGQMHALEAAGPLESSFIHELEIVTALSSTEQSLYYAANQPDSLMPISAHGCHLPAIFSAAPVLCGSPRPFAPPVLALD